MNLNHDQVVSPVKNNPPSWLNSAAVNMRCTYPSGLCFSPDICRSGIAGWYGSSVFSFFLWNLHSALHSGWLSGPVVRKTEILYDTTYNVESKKVIQMILKLAIPGKVETRWVNTSSKSTDAISAENLRQTLCDHFPLNISYLLIFLVGLGRSVSWIAMHPLVMVRLPVQWQG